MAFIRTPGALTPRPAFNRGRAAREA